MLACPREVRGFNAGVRGDLPLGRRLEEAGELLRRLGAWSWLCGGRAREGFRKGMGNKTAGGEVPQLRMLAEEPRYDIPHLS